MLSSNKLYLGIDLGTSSIKVSIADIQANILYSVSNFYKTYSPNILYSEQDPNDWLNALIVCIDSIKNKFDLNLISAMSFCGQMHGLVMLDKFDKVLHNAILWDDNRSIDETNYLNNVISKDKLKEYTGNIAFPGFTAPKLLWIKNNENEIFKQIDKIMLPKDYLVYKITGYFVSDVSDSSGTLYYDCKNKTYSKEMLEILGININQLPKVYESYEVISLVSESFSKLTGIPRTCKVVVGGGDQAVGAIGCGNVLSNKLSVSLGSSGVIFASTDTFKENSCEGIHNFCHANGRYHQMGVILSATKALDWWLNNILNAKSITKELSNLTESNDLIFLPYLCGERSPINNPNAKAELYGLNLTHTRSNLTLAIIEGVSLALKDCLSKINVEKLNFGIVIGGGSKSQKWCQVLSNCLNLKLKTLKQKEGGVLGAIILSLVGDNVYENVNVACQKLIRFKKTYYPEPNEVVKFDQKYIKFKDLYEKTIK